MLQLQQKEQTMEKISETLQKNELFAGLPDGEVESVLSCLGYFVKKYPKNDMVWNAGDKTDSFGIVVSGQVHVIREDYFGKRSIVAAIGPGGIFGEAFVCAGVKAVPVAVAAERESEVLFLNIDKILTSCGNACAFHSTLIKRLVRLLARKNIQLNQKTDFLSRRTTREKLGAYLLSQYSRQETNPFLVDLNRTERADYLSVDRSAMSRELSRLKAEGVIDYWKNSFQILDFDRFI